MFLASVAVPVGVMFAVKGDVGTTPPTDVEAAPIEDLAISSAGAATPCCVEFIAVGSSAPSLFGGDMKVAPAASRLRTVERTLAAGVASEQGLQVRTILTARAISEVFPEIRQIGGVRQDALRWHPDGLALDVMIQNPGSAEGIALGNQIVAFALKNAQRFGIQDAIWRGVYYTPSGARPGGYGHYDHVHITTTGGGYPDGNETYYR